MAILNKNIALAIAALAACGTAAASEDYDLRYAPGYGAADMSAPFEGGWVFQAHAYVYSGNVRGSQTINTDISKLVNPALGAGSVTASTTLHTNDQINVWGLLPRLSYMSSTTFLGATVGATALLPLVDKSSMASVTGVSTTLGGTILPGIPAPTQAFLVNSVNTSAAQTGAFLTNANSNRTFYAGDLEVSPILRWAGEATQTLFVLTAVLPTGDYDPTRAANPGAGDFYTIRPAVQFSYIGDGWDVGTRVAYSYNTRNKLTKYKTGSYVNWDLALMKSVSESTRLGVSGYMIDQLTVDESNLSAEDCVAKFGTVGCEVVEARQAGTLGQKGRAFGAGPEVAYIHGAGDFLLEGRVMKEFGVETRPKGFTAIVSLSKPF